MIDLFTIVGILSALIYLCILLYLSIGIICTRTELTDEQPFVSVIIAAHNEDKNIASCLDSLINQDYPEEKTGTKDFFSNRHNINKENVIPKFVNILSNEMISSLPFLLRTYSSKFI